MTSFNLNFSQTFGGSTQPNAFRSIQAQSNGETNTLANSKFQAKRRRQGRSTAATDRLYPANSGIVNVKTEYGAKGDGVTDDTAAIQRAIQDYVGFNGKKKTLFFPRGTYLVSKTLEWKNKAGSWSTYLTFQGQNRDNTIIKLKDRATGFGNASLPKAVIYTAAMGSTQGNSAHNNFFENLTIDTGRGNVGAIGIDYLSNNRGAIRDVAIRSGDGTGAIGLSMSRPWVGPALLEDVQIDGFNIGMKTVGPEYSITMKDIILRNQKVVGIDNVWQVLNIEKLTSQNAVPAIRNRSMLTQDNRGMVVLLNSSLTGGSAANVAIDNTVGQVYARNVSTSGYQAALKNGNSIVPGLNLSRYMTSPVEQLFPTLAAPTSLPIESSPSFHDNNFSNWANVIDYGAIPGDFKDDSAAIQAALNSGKSTIYFPTGQYHTNKTLKVAGNVRKLVGLESNLGGIGTVFSNAGRPTPVLRFETGSATAVFVEKLNVGGTGSGLVSIEQATNKTLVVRDSELGGIGFRNAPGAGKLFLEDVVASRLRFDYPQNIWARHLNAEDWAGYPGNESVPKIRNNGANLWIMGLKTESPSVVIETVGGGKTELLGGLIYPVQAVPESIPAFINNNAQSMLTYAVSAYDSNRNHKLQVRDTRNGVTRNLFKSDVLQRDNFGSIVPLYMS